MWDVNLEGESLEDLIVFLGGLQKFPRIRSLRLMLVRLHRRMVMFLPLAQPMCLDLKYDEEYILVDASGSCVEFHGREEVRAGLKTMAECIEVA